MVAVSKRLSADFSGMGGTSAPGQAFVIAARSTAKLEYRCLVEAGGMSSVCVRLCVVVCDCVVILYEVCPPIAFACALIAVGRCAVLAACCEVSCRGSSRSMVRWHCSMVSMVSMVSRRVVESSRILEHEVV